MEQCVVLQEANVWCVLEANVVLQDANIHLQANDQTRLHSVKSDSSVQSKVSDSFSEDPTESEHSFGLIKSLGIKILQRIIPVQLSPCCTHDCCTATTI